MSLKNQSMDLTLEDLLFLQKHLKLGKAHLENCLSQKEFETIFEWIQLPPKKEKELSATIAEIAGQWSLVFNTILTGALGFWLGLSSLLHLALVSKSTLSIVLTFSFVVGGFIGFQSILFVKKKGRNALDEQKLKNLELEIVKRINLHKEKALKEKIDALISLLKNLKIHVKQKELSDPQTDFQKMCLNWVSHIKGTDALRNHLEREIQRRDQYIESTKNLKKIVQKLSHHSISLRISIKTWIESNLSRLIIESIPTLFGGVASLFVYIGGTRAVTEEIGNETWIFFLERPEVKIVQLVFVVLITFYFAFSFFYMNRRTFKRDKEMIKIQMHLIREERQMDLSNDHLLKMNECLNILEPLCKESR